MQEPAGPSHYAAHLAAYWFVLIPIRSDACVFGVIDVDTYDNLDLPALAARIKEMGLPLIVCRSKSGARILSVSLEATTAARVRALLAEWAAALGYPGVEIFPKQVALDPDETGNGINLPYFNAEHTTRYAVNGKAMQFDEFLLVAENMRTTIEAAEAIEPPPRDADKSEDVDRDENDSAPKQVNERRNIFLTSKAGALHNLGITSFDDKLAALRAINQNVCDPPLPDKDSTIARAHSNGKQRDRRQGHQGFDRLVVSARELLARGSRRVNTSSRTC